MIMIYLDFAQTSLVHLTYCRLVMTYCDTDLSQRWLSLRRAAWWQEAITWTNIDYPSCSAAFTWEQFNIKYPGHYHVQ